MTGAARSAIERPTSPHRVAADHLDDLPGHRSRPLPKKWQYSTEHISSVPEPFGTILGVLDMYQRFSMQWYRWHALKLSDLKVDFDSDLPYSWGRMHLHMHMWDMGGDMHIHMALP